MALAFLPLKGFIAITNSGDELIDPKKNLGEALIWSLSVCLLVYTASALTVGSYLAIDQIVLETPFMSRLRDR